VRSGIAEGVGSDWHTAHSESIAARSWLQSAHCATCSVAIKQLNSPSCPSSSSRLRMMKPTQSAAPLLMLVPQVMLSTVCDVSHPCCGRILEAYLVGFSPGRVVFYPSQTTSTLAELRVCSGQSFLNCFFDIFFSRVVNYCLYFKSIRNQHF